MYYALNQDNLPKPQFKAVPFHKRDPQYNLDKHDIKEENYEGKTEDHRGNA